MYLTGQFLQLFTGEKNIIQILVMHKSNLPVFENCYAPQLGIRGITFYPCPYGMGQNTCRFLLFSCGCIFDFPNIHVYVLNLLKCNQTFDMTFKGYITIVNFINKWEFYMGSLYMCAMVKWLALPRLTVN